MKKLDAFNTTFIVLLSVFSICIAIAITKVVGIMAQNEVKRRFQNIYSAYTQALLRTVEQMAGETGCYYSTDRHVKHNFSDCDKFYTIFVSNLQLEKYCQEKALKGGCVPEYLEYTSKPECFGFSRNMLNNYADAFVMSDSSNLIIYNEIDKQRRPIFAVDANGFAKPNQAGVDLFSMTIMRNRNGSYFFHSNVSYCLPVKKDGIHNLTDVYK